MISGFLCSVVFESLKCKLLNFLLVFYLCWMLRGPLNGCCTILTGGSTSSCSAEFVAGWDSIAVRRIGTLLSFHWVSESKRDCG